MMSRAKPPAERTGNEWRKKLVAPGNDAFVTPHPPASVNNIARWESIWALGGPTGVYNVRADYEIVARYCEYVERRATMTAILDEEGWTIEGNNGSIWPHPMARFVSDVEKKLGPIEDRLGLNPQARNTIAIGQVAMQSALEDWLDG
jgi:P27 family predicted phage terminase small subunit